MDLSDKSYELIQQLVDELDNQIDTGEMILYIRHWKAGKS